MAHAGPDSSPDAPPLWALLFIHGMWAMATCGCRQTNTESTKLTWTYPSCQKVPPAPRKYPSCSGSTLVSTLGLGLYFPLVLIRRSRSDSGCTAPSLRLRLSPSVQGLRLSPSVQGAPPIPCPKEGPPASSTRHRPAASGQPTWGDSSRHVDVTSLNS